MIKLLATEVESILVVNYGSTRAKNGRRAEFLAERYKALESSLPFHCALSSLIRHDFRNIHGDEDLPEEKNGVLNPEPLDK
jgi:hypothetical protein